MSDSVQVSTWVAKYAQEIDSGLGPVLDLACGAGRHSIYLNTLGCNVIGLDRDQAQLQLLHAKGINVVSCDLESSTTNTNDYVWPFAPNVFSAIVVTNYLHRPLFSELLRSIKPHGLLIYETFAIGNERYGRPKNPRFLLEENELLRRCIFETSSEALFDCLAFEHGLVNQTSPAIVQRICARRR